MKKEKMKDRQQDRRPRRLSLSRETIRLLDDPALLGLARGGVQDIDTKPLGGACCPTGSSS